MNENQTMNEDKCNVQIVKFENPSSEYECCSSTKNRRTEPAKQFSFHPNLETISIQDNLAQTRDYQKKGNSGKKTNTNQKRKQDEKISKPKQNQTSKQLQYQNNQQQRKSENLFSNSHKSFQRSNDDFKDQPDLISNSPNSHLQKFESHHEIMTPDMIKVPEVTFFMRHTATNIEGNSHSHQRTKLHSQKMHLSSQSNDVNNSTNYSGYCPPIELFVDGKFVE
ncbi:hypothetical protein TRFO_24669 [Tritrichomonas foetus]|uniref:Uncharacterized protein n=1 Tax=Tritrichomonas foetus TaxID=1144522 RepID=A0A1J4K707_9EUKA|nr:hypothetical protein TRFO_24669 [Tritrichomonas foetus]|eukprot:OHT07257.1 hypothetical protein TRFO_24669 [Tritrichomonas foetus]